SPAISACPEPPCTGASNSCPLATVKYQAVSWPHSGPQIDKDVVAMARDHRSSTSGETASREHTATFRWQILRRHVEDGTPLTQLADLEGIGVLTLQRWLAAYRRDGVAGLLPVVPKRARRTHPALQTLIEGLALSNPKLSIAAITRKAQAKATQQGWPMVSYSTVRAIIIALDPGMVTRAQQGSAAYRAK